ncbi:MAG: prepilin-type N-terminal cleavage/methylation domain-containing protein [Phycisphaerales bacterium]|nr:prepilin-type N-terminal cleavage/methylation domain-containing protein [Phycisphaerales bacterium]
MTHSHGRITRGFTLVELLAVVIIIGLLISILVPSVNAVRKNANNAATKSTISSLSTGLEMFKADGRIGGAYPPSVSDNNPTGGVGSQRTVEDPYYNLPNRNRRPSFSNQVDMGGAGLLVWALAGADRLGCPGFKPFRSGNSNPNGLWSLDTGADFDNSQPSSSRAYALYPVSDATRGGQPVHSRSGPYVDIQKVKMTQYNQQNGQFDIDAERRAVGPTAPLNRPYPMFLDSFGFPILYFRADPAGPNIADRDPRGINSNNSAQRGRYHFQDNAALLQGSSPLKLKAGAAAHKLTWTGGQNYAPITGNIDQQQYGFAAYIRDPNVNAKNAPQNADTFLLISPGFDGVYGTGDDVTNFEPNGL